MELMKGSPPRSDLRAYEQAMRLPFSAMVKELRSILGSRLVAHVAGVSETRAVNQWADGAREVKSTEIAERLRLALRLALMLREHDAPATVQGWFQGLNPYLDDQVPATLLREGDLAKVGPRVLAAARAFVSEG
jgi:hypothetical protein